VANLIFYVMAALVVVGALGVVVARNPMMSILSLLASFFALASIYLLAGFQTLAALQILVYAGAILVLNLADEKPLERIDMALFHERKTIWTLVVAGALLGIGAFTALELAPPAVAAGVQIPEHGIDDLQGLANAMFSRYLLSFEIISVLLLATAVAVVVLAKRNRGTPRLDQGGEST